MHITKSKESTVLKAKLLLQPHRLKQGREQVQRVEKAGGRAAMVLGLREEGDGMGRHR